MTKQDEINITNAIKTMREFMPTSELNTIITAMRGEEKQFFINKLLELDTIIKSMPKTYEQDGKGNQAIAHLHYFKGSADWYITEKDAGTPEEPGQRQAFGLCDLGFGFPELGYVSIPELLNAQVELDLYFEPKALEEIKINT